LSISTQHLRSIDVQCEDLYELISCLLPEVTASPAQHCTYPIFGKHSPNAGSKLCFCVSFCTFVPFLHESAIHSLRSLLRIFLFVRRDHHRIGHLLLLFYKRLRVRSLLIRSCVLLSVAPANYRAPFANVAIINHYASLLLSGTLTVPAQSPLLFTLLYTHLPRAMAIPTWQSDNIKGVSHLPPVTSLVTTP
jgi:hypothetical protein